MRILIDIGHPAHVHLFKCFAHEMIKKGHEVLFTCRDKEFEIALLSSEGFNYISFGKKYKSKYGKVWGLVKFTLKEYKAARKFKPDFFMSHGSLYAAIASSMVHKPHVSFEDTFNFEQIRIYRPFTNVILTSDYEHPFISGKEIHYAGYHELAYLHPNRFVPNSDVLKDMGVTENEKFVLVRFVAWNATHDIGHNGVSHENKVKLVRELSKYAKVFISSEAKLPEDMKQYQIHIDPSKMHDVLAYASLVFGESATMVSEGVVLGTPGIYLDNTGRYYTEEEQNRYDMCYCYSESEEDQLKAISKALELIQRDDLKSEWQLKRKELLKDKIDVTGFLTWFVENYPESVKTMRDNPEYQYKFR